MSTRQLRDFVLAIDPGKLTGLSLVWWRDPETYDAWELDFRRSGAMIKDVCEQFGQHLDVACEQFTITMRTVKNSQAPWSLEMIGIARYFCQIYTGQDLAMYEQKPPFSTDERLKALGWYRATPDGHANDAGRQALRHLVECGFRDERLWPEKVDKLSI